MKVVLEIQNRNDVFNGRDTYRIMVDTDGLSVVREKIMAKSEYGWGYIVGYAVVIKNSNSGEVFYTREFKKQVENKKHDVESEKVSFMDVTQQCNKEMTLTIQKIQDAINYAKKRHLDFTEPIQLEHYGH